MFLKIKKITLWYNYYRAFKDYNNLININFGQRVVFDLKNINKSKFEDQVYNAIYDNYKRILVDDEIFKRTIIILQSNLYGSEKRNYNFIIPIMVSIFSFAGTFIINASKLSDPITLIFNFVYLVIVFYAYMLGIKLDHRKYCNLLTYYNLCLGIVNQLYEEYKSDNDVQKEIAATLDDKNNFFMRLFKKKNDR
ncbi:hypothetical protein JHL18_00625 [Clostridium sp. YIM B02505]|uniref:SMODS and SLOG-associating 2TM effector domain-containing protein n=1 Tax=Clostridium yunnanense TaxID=2800325 RepID=A0ABS1EIF2_9CLOT|nr:hypothetical protein [Clostridium yunnanense]MBK1809152.1 hypothetical protein [Clostridium yunnanense]